MPDKLAASRSICLEIFETFVKTIVSGNTASPKSISLESLNVIELKSANSPNDVEEKSAFSAKDAPRKSENRPKVDEAKLARPSKRAPLKLASPTTVSFSKGKFELNEADEASKSWLKITLEKSTWPF